MWQVRTPLSTLTVGTESNHVLEFVLLHLCPLNDVVDLKRFSPFANGAAIPRLNHQVSLKCSRDWGSVSAHKS